MADNAAARGVSDPLVDRAPAKVNLTLSILGRRADGYHELESLVVFAALADRLSFEPDGPLRLQLKGPNAQACGSTDDNLVLKAARALAGTLENARSGRFELLKRLPVAAGIGGGSADAAAALRLLARASGLALDDARLFAAARATGADVPVCLDPRPRLMRGVGEVLSAPLDLPALPSLLVNPGVAVPTRDVFAALGLPVGSAPLRRAASSADLALDIPRERDALFAFLMDHANDLERPAISLQPVIAEVLDLIRDQPNCRLARMSGSGATCLGLFGSLRAAQAAARAIKAARAHWWVRATMLGNG